VAKLAGKRTLERRSLADVASGAGRRRAAREGAGHLLLAAAGDPRSWAAGDAMGRGSRVGIRAVVGRGEEQEESRVSSCLPVCHSFSPSAAATGLASKVARGKRRRTQVGSRPTDARCKLAGPIY
jgi:hypothetical protein